MSEKRSRKSRVVRWALSIIALLPLYLVSYPPIICAFMEYDMTTAAPEWDIWYGAPYEWIRTHTPLDDLLTKYDAWCFRVTLARMQEGGR